MSESVLDRGFLLPDPFTAWYRKRPFQIAFALSVVVHALLITFVPAFRSVQIEPPQVLNVQIAPLVEEPKMEEAKPVAPPKPVEPKVVSPRPRVEPPPIVHEPLPPKPVEPQIVRPAPRVEPPPAVREQPVLEPEPVPPAVAKIEPPPAPVVPVAPPPDAPVPEVKSVPPQVAEPVVPPPPAPPEVAVVRPPPAAVPAPPAPPVIDEKQASELTAGYSQQVAAQIKKHQNYPLIAKRRQWEGTAQVRLIIGADGTVKNVELGKGTGKDVLDKEALEMVRRASPLPQAPLALRGRALTVTVPIVFRLQDS
jgi:periplasmic protein TonB